MLKMVNNVGTNILKTPGKALEKTQKPEVQLYVENLKKP